MIDMLEGDKKVKVGVVALIIGAVIVILGVSLYLVRSSPYVSKDVVREDVKKHPGTMTPGIGLEFKSGTVEIISVNFMTGKEWNEKFFYDAENFHQRDDE